ncbi:MAG TPA: hypothetical protein VI199_03650 [Novosphingobium sp.]
MSEWEIIDDGRWNGLRKLLRATDDNEGTVEVKYEDVGASSAIIAANQADESFNPRADMWKVGSIPASIAYKWLVEDGLNIWNPAHADGVKRKLMDPDYRYLVPGFRRIIM